ncbi:MAG: hypothetical protein C4547_12215 [Phycisphaerales bacterium]|nr:MAG: hypothetical protein C4547_12215 [Phycisphaerales bacterium]
MASGISDRAETHLYRSDGSCLRGMVREADNLPQDVGAYHIRYVLIEEDRERSYFEHFAIGCLAPMLNK